MLSAAGTRAFPLFESAGRSEESGRRVLLISYHFPPDSSIGARRWEKLAPFLTERGWGLDVIMRTPEPGADFRRLKSLPAGVRVFGVPAVTHPIERVEWMAWRVYRWVRDGGRSAGLGGRVPSLDVKSGGESARASLIDRAEIRWRLHTPRGLLRAYWAWLECAKAGAWARRAVALAKSILEPGVHIAVVTSGPPHMTHDAGRAISAHAGLPFVMDMRDPWNLAERLPEGVASPVRLRLARRYERVAVGQAALVVANTEAAREALAAAYPSLNGRLITVMNGSDDDPLPRSRHGYRFTVAYAGTIYRMHHARQLFQAAACVIRELGLGPADFGVEIIGADVEGQHTLGEMARAAGIAEFVSAGPTRPHAETLEVLARAAMLVTFPGWDSTTIPAKIFEYVRFEAWLLALADSGSAADRLLRGIGVDVAEPSDVPGIAAAIGRRYEQYRRGVRPVRPVTDDRLSRGRQARILLDALEKVLARGKDVQKR